MKMRFAEASFDRRTALIETTNDPIVANCDLDDCELYKETIFDFARRGWVVHYGLVTEQTGAVTPV